MSGFVDMDQAQTLIKKGALVVDVRTQKEWDEGHAPGSLHLPLDQLAVRFEELPRDKPLLMVCLSGGRSQTAMNYMLQQGYVDVHNLGPWTRNPNAKA
jgi:rhodanese-related sulfurtransferase